jgi:hypothetical protein
MLAGHPGEFGTSGFWSAGEHDPAGGDDGIELAALEGKALRIGNAVFDIELLCTGALLCGSDQILAEINADHLCPAPDDPT